MCHFLGSDRVGELGERVRDTTLRTSVDTEFVVAAADVLHQCVTADDRARRPVAFESAHRTEPSFESAVVVLDPLLAYCSVL